MSVVIYTGCKTNWRKYLTESGHREHLTSLYLETKIEGKPANDLAALRENDTLSPLALPEEESRDDPRCKFERLRFVDDAVLS
jgi:hypothetical protein